MALIHLENIHFSYGKLKALDGVSLSIDGGAIGLLGPNGAGKSTLMKTLLGFIRPQEGQVTIFGHTLPQHVLQVRQRLGYMPERDLMSPNVSAVSFLTYCGAMFGMTRPDAIERAHAVLNYVGMGENRYRKMETYSKGMCQRVKFAQALIHDPKLLLLDEPTNGLDPDGRIEMLELIRELAHKRNVTIILSTHLLPDAEHVCDHLVIINKGRIVRDDTMEALTTVKDDTFEVKVYHHHEAFREALRALGCTCDSHHDGALLVQKPPNVSINAIFQTARNQDTHLRHLRPVRQRLEETFMEAIGER